MLNIEPAIRVLIGLIEGVRNDQLTAPTPCRECTLGGLIDHVSGFSMTFTAAAGESQLDSGGPGPAADASGLEDDWRIQIPERLVSLAAAWRSESAWSGMTQAGGRDLPAEMAGVITLDEVLVHGWDISVASGQDFTCDPLLVQAAYDFVTATVAQSPQGSPGLFGPPVPIPDGEPLLYQLIGLTGRDPAWRASG
jgi:uncharacterized protein (TIGR03086 family)